MPSVQYNIQIPLFLLSILTMASLANAIPKMKGNIFTTSCL